MGKKITNDIPDEKHVLHSQLDLTNSDLSPYFSWPI